MVDPRWPPFDNYDVITPNMTPTTLVTDLKGTILGCTIYTPSVIVIALVAEYRGGCTPPTSLGPEDGEKVRSRWG